MPTYKIAESEIEIARSPEACLLDTGVLVAVFSGSDEHHEAAKEFVDNFGPLYMPFGVVVETWGMLVGSMRDWRAGYGFLTWINTPGKITLIPDTVYEFDVVYEEITARERIDVVDAFLLRLVLCLINNLQ